MLDGGPWLVSVSRSTEDMTEFMLILTHKLLNALDPFLIFFFAAYEYFVCSHVGRDDEVVHIQVILNPAICGVIQYFRHRSSLILQISSDIFFRGLVHTEHSSGIVVCRTYAVHMPVLQL